MRQVQKLMPRRQGTTARSLAMMACCMIPQPLLYVFCGAFVGLLIGLTGVGGGSLMTPLLVLGFGQPPAVAVGTDLVFSATTKLAATAASGFSRRVDWRIVGRLALGSVPACAAVLAWLWMAHRTPVVLDAVVSRCLAVILAIAALALLLQPWLRRIGLSLTAAWLDNAQRHKVAFTVAAGTLLGAGVALTSVGAGALGIVALLALYPLRLTADRLVATDIAHALPITALAGAGHALLGHTDLRILACLLVGSIPGILLASRLTIRLPAAFTRTLIALMLAVVAERLLFGVY
jgi:uncharacterized membrane protein YfcA